MPLSDEEKDAPDRVVATRKRTEMKTVQSYMVLATLAAVNVKNIFLKLRSQKHEEAPSYCL